eukprot:1411352-Prymnesium_polylepis.1
MRLPRKQRHRNERRELRPCLHRAFESTFILPAAPLQAAWALAALRKPAVSHGTQCTPPWTHLVTT